MILLIMSQIMQYLLSAILLRLVFNTDYTCTNQIYICKRLCLHFVCHSPLIADIRYWRNSMSTVIGVDFGGSLGTCPPIIGGDLGDGQNFSQTKLLPALAKAGGSRR